MMLRDGRVGMPAEWGGGEEDVIYAVLDAERRAGAGGGEATRIAATLDEVGRLLPPPGRTGDEVASALHGELRVAQRAAQRMVAGQRPSEAAVVVAATTTTTTTTTTATGRLMRTGMRPHLIRRLSVE